MAIGELADGLQINLDRVPKKYAGLDGTELAISESQERMAVVVDPKDVDRMLKYADEENLEATVVATVTEEPRMVISWRGKEIVNLSRRFIDTNGAHQETTVSVAMPQENEELRMKNEESACASDLRQPNSSFFILHSSFFILTSPRVCLWRCRRWSRCGGGRGRH